MSTDEDGKHATKKARLLAFAFLLIGWGLAYGFWPTSLGSSGALLQLVASSTIGFGATLVAGLLWE